MQNQNVDILISEANKLLEKATKDLQRSEKDMTNFMVCHNSRQSMINYLTSFLIKNGIELNQPVTLAGLMDQCREEDERFQLIDISGFNCRHDEHDEEFCLDFQKVNSCLKIAEQTRNIATNETPAY